MEIAPASSAERPAGSAFTLKTLLVLVVAAGVGIGAIRYPSDLCKRVVFSVTITLLLLSILAAWFGPARVRAFCSGFALCGLAYLVLMLGPWFDANIARLLLPSDWVTSLAMSLPRVGTGDDAYFTGPDSNGSLFNQHEVTIVEENSGKFRLDFHRGSTDASAWYDPSLLAATRETVERATLITHALFALIFGLLGGWVAALLARWSSRAPKEIPDRQER